MCTYHIIHYYRTKEVKYLLTIQQDRMLKKYLLLPN